MARRVALVWIFTLTPLLGVNLSSVRAQYEASGNRTTYFAGDSRNATPQQMATADAPVQAVPGPSSGKSPIDVCPTCGGSCNQCNCDNCGACFVWDRDTWVKVGAGVRTSFNSVDEDFGARSGQFNYFTPDNTRLYVSGQGHEVIAFDLNADIFDPTQRFASPNDLAEVRLLDGVVKFHLDDLCNVFIGRFRPPSDRSNLSGPFYINVWDLPFVSAYPYIYEGRDTGAAYWGQVGGGVLKWQAGVFNGTGRTGVAPPNPGGSLIFAGRVTINLLDPEPGYYNQSTYYGKKDILAIGAVVMAQKDATNAPGPTPEDFTGWNVDFLFEKKLSNDGVITLEAAYYDYNDGQTADVPGASVRQGEAGFVTLEYLTPYEFGVGKMCGRLQPFCRWQNYNHDFKASAAALNAAAASGAANIFSQGVDIGANYIIAGHNARLTAFWGERDLVGGGSYSIFRAGAQVQF